MIYQTKSELIDDPMAPKGCEGYSLKPSGKPAAAGKRSPHVPMGLPETFKEGEGVRVAGLLFEIVKIKRGTMTLKLL